MRRLFPVLFTLALASAGAFAAVDVGIGADVHLGHHSDLNIGFFYQSLAPHGEWVSLKDYGYVWQPSVVVQNENWRPYCDEGHWVWSDDGWYWVSDYEWGWAPFHYGRWTYDTTYRWVWVPDVTWGPAWVAFREGGSHFGWAPLPPGAEFEAGVGLSFRGRNIAAGFDFGLGANLWTFVPSNRFLAVNVATVAVPVRESTTVFRETRTVNNSITVNDHRVVNSGIPVQTVSRATNQQVKPLHIESQNTVTPAKTHVSGDRIAAFRPQIKNEKPANAETLIKEAKSKGTSGSGAAAQPKTAAQPGTSKSEEKPISTQYKRNQPENQPKAEQPSTNKPAGEKTTPGARSQETNKPAAEHPEANKPATVKHEETNRQEANKPPPPSNTNRGINEEARRSEVNQRGPAAEHGQAEHGQAAERRSNPHADDHHRTDVNSTKNDTELRKE